MKSLKIATQFAAVVLYVLLALFMPTAFDGYGQRKEGEI